MGVVLVYKPTFTYLGGPILYLRKAFMGVHKNFTLLARLRIGDAQDRPNNFPPGIFHFSLALAPF